MSSETPSAETEHHWPTPGTTPELPAMALRLLRCPTCHQEMGGEDGSLKCANGHTWPIRQGFVDFVSSPQDESTAATSASFGYEWNSFSNPRPEDEGNWRRYFSGVDLSLLAGRLALDAGCGMGRYTRFTASYVEALVALDGSDAVEAAARNLADTPNTLVIKADLRNPPLGPRTFGFVSCLGVLHHLSDPLEGFRALTNLLEEGGLLLIYVYSRPAKMNMRAVGLAAARMLRRLTRRIPFPWLRALSAPIAAVLYGFVVWPGTLGDLFGIHALSGLPLTVYRKLPLRALWLDTFDRLSAPIEFRYVWRDVEPWFRDAGLEVLSIDTSTGLTILAKKRP